MVGLVLATELRCSLADAEHLSQLLFPQTCLYAACPMVKASAAQPMLEDPQQAMCCRKHTGSQARFPGWLQPPSVNRLHRLCAKAPKVPLPTLNLLHITPSHNTIAVRTHKPVCGPGLGTATTGLQSAGPKKAGVT